MLKRFSKLCNSPAKLEVKVCHNDYDKLSELLTHIWKIFCNLQEPRLTTCSWRRKKYTHFTYFISDQGL